MNLVCIVSFMMRAEASVSEVGPVPPTTISCWNASSIFLNGVVCQATDDRRLRRDIADPVELVDLELRAGLVGELGDQDAALHEADHRAVLRRDIVDAVAHQHAAGAGLVLDDDGRIAGDELAEVARHQPGERIIAAARVGADDEGDLLCRDRNRRPIARARPSRPWPRRAPRQRARSRSETEKTARRTSPIDDRSALAGTLAGRSPSDKSDFTAEGRTAPWPAMISTNSAGKAMLFDSNCGEHPMRRLLLAGLAGLMLASVPLATGLGPIGWHGPGWYGGHYYGHYWGERCGGRRRASRRCPGRGRDRRIGAAAAAAGPVYLYPPNTRLGYCERQLPGFDADSGTYIAPNGRRVRCP